MSTIKQKSSINVHRIMLNAMLIALVFVATAVINIRLPFVGTGGLIHLGNVPLFIGALLFGRRSGMIAGAFGMGLFDLMGGWTAWAPFTFVIVGCMGYVVGWFAEKKPIHQPYVNDIAALVLALIIKIVGYYLAEVFIIQSWALPLGSIPGNIVQVGVAAVITLAAMPVFRRVLRPMGQIA